MTFGHVARFADFVASTALCEPRCADFVAGTALCEPRCADIVAGTALSHFVNLAAQISWQAQHLIVNLDVQLS